MVSVMRMRWVWAGILISVLLAGCGEPDTAATPMPPAGATATLVSTATPDNGSATETPAPTPTPLSPTPTASESPISNPQSPTPTQAETPDLSQTYTNSIIGYSFNYPSDWNATSFGLEDGKAVYLFSYDPASVTGKSEGVPAGETKIDVGAPFVEKFATLDDFMNFIKQSIANDGGATTVLAEERFTLPSGWETVYLKTETTFGIGEAYHLVINGNGLIVGSGSAEPGMLRRIVETLRPNQ